MNAPRLFVAAACLLLIGAGCDLSTKISLRNPFTFIDIEATDSASSSLAVRREAGLGIAIRPSFLGVTGTLSDLVGHGTVKRATLETADETRLEIAWNETRDGTESSGRIVAIGHASAHEMFLPAFWPEGEATLNGNGLLWLSTEAFRELTEDGTTEWMLGLGGEKAVAGADAALKSFNAAAARIFGTATATNDTASPFTITDKGRNTAYPLRRNGKSETFRVVIASSWFADYIILDNPENPLILKAVVNPLALGALETLAPTGVDPKTVGYEVVEITSSP